MKTHARVIVIGGGAVGASALYHLTQLGLTDVELLERDEPTAGSTWHAAGNCPNFSTSWNLLKLQRHSTKVYAELGQRVGCDINYHVTGSTDSPTRATGSTNSGMSFHRRARRASSSRC